MRGRSTRIQHKVRDFRKSYEQSLRKSEQNYDAEMSER